MSSIVSGEDEKLGLFNMQRLSMVKEMAVKEMVVMEMEMEKEMMQLTAPNAQERGHLDHDRYCRC